MKLSELVEAKAREAANRYWKVQWKCAASDTEPIKLPRIIESAIIATLNECGFREALDLVHRNRFLCQNCRRSIWDGKCNETSPCTCPYHTAEAKLKELEEMSK